MAQALVRHGKSIWLETLSSSVQHTPMCFLVRSAEGNAYIFSVLQTKINTTGCCWSERKFICLRGPSGWGGDGGKHINRALFPRHLLKSNLRLCAKKVVSRNKRTRKPCDVDYGGQKSMSVELSGAEPLRNLNHYRCGSSQIRARNLSFDDWNIHLALRSGGTFSPLRVGLSPSVLPRHRCLARRVQCGLPNTEISTRYLFTNYGLDPGLPGVLMIDISI